MEVSIDHEEQSRGIIFKKPFFTCRIRVVFTPEEETLIKKHALADNYLTSEDDSDPAYGRPVRHLRGNGSLYGNSDLSRVKRWENEMKTGLVALKDTFEGVAAHEPNKSEKFTL